MVCSEPGTGTSRAAWEAVAGVLAGWPPEYLRTAAVQAADSCIKRHAAASAWLSGGISLLLAEVLPLPAAGRHVVAPARQGARSRPGCGGV